MERRIGSALVLAIITVGLAGAQSDYFPMGAAGTANLESLPNSLPDIESLGGNWAWVDCAAYGESL